MGPLGVHRFYVGKYKSGILQLITLGGIGFWSVFDLIIIANQKFSDSKGNKIKTNDKKYLNIGIIICIIVIILEIVTFFYGFNKIKEFDLISKLNNIKSISKSEKNNIQGIQVFMFPEATQYEIEMLRNELKKIKNVTTIELETKEEAYDNMRERMGENQKLLDNFTPDIFSVSYILTIDSDENIDTIVNNIEKIDNVKDVLSSDNSTQNSEIINKSANALLYILLFTIIYRIINITVITFVCFIIIDKKRKEGEEY